MSNSAQTLFETAPLGALVAFSDGSPRPPARFTRKVRAWQDRNATGRLPGLYDGLEVREKAA